MLRKKERKSGKSLLEILFFPEWSGDNLRVPPGTRLRAAVVVGALFVILVAVYWVFDLGAFLPKRAWQR